MAKRMSKQQGSKESKAMSAWIIGERTTNATTGYLLTNSIRGAAEVALLGKAREMKEANITNATISSFSDHVERDMHLAENVLTVMNMADFKRKIEGIM